MTQRNRLDHPDHYQFDAFAASGSGARRGRSRSAFPGITIDGVTLYRTLVPTLASRNGSARGLGTGAGEQSRVREFLALLLDEDDDGCEDYLLAHAAPSGDPQAAATDLLGPAARLVGDYWRMDVCDFMKVTVVMGRIQRLFWNVASLYPPRAGPRDGRTALLSPLPNEQHSFGLAVVDDALRRAGWQVDCCGLGEEEAFLALLSANRYSVVGISLSGNALAPGLAAFIARSRKKSRNASVRIMVGGGILVEKPELAFEAGADLVAADAYSAVSMAETAVASAARAS